MDTDAHTNTDLLYPVSDPYIVLDYLQIHYYEDVWGELHHI